MGYTSGLGNLQQIFGAAGAGATDKAAAASKTEQSGLNAAMRQFATGTTAGDQANLSTAGALISQAMSGTDVRFEKVAALQQSIAAGTYNVPSSAVAGKLIDTMSS
jgi:negative regulator of flagellin synthesis FlgM